MSIARRIIPDNACFRHNLLCKISDLPQSTKIIFFKFGQSVLFLQKSELDWAIPSL